MLQSANHTAAAPAFLVLLCAMAAGLWAAPADAQSFDCRLAHYPDEETICEHAGLGQLDQELARRYRQEYNRLGKEQRDAFEQHETLFVISRRRCGESIRCIEQSYRNRIRELDNMLSDSDEDGSANAASTEDRGSEPQPARRAPANSTAAAPAKPAAPTPVAKTSVTERGALETAGSGTSLPRPAPEPARRTPERATTTVLANPTPLPEPETLAPAPPVKRTPEHHARRSRKIETTTTTIEAPAPSGSTTPTPAPPESQAAAVGAAGKPTIHWVDPAPGR